MTLIILIRRIRLICVPFLLIMKLLLTIDEENYSRFLEFDGHLCLFFFQTNEKVGDRWSGEVELRKPSGEHFWAKMQKAIVLDYYGDEESFYLKNVSKSDIEIGTTVWIPS